MIKLDRFQLAAVKRTAQSVKMRRRQADKVRKLKEENEKLLESLEKEISMWETPIVDMTGGYTSEEVLNLINDNMEIPEKEKTDASFPPFEEEIPTEPVLETVAETTVETTPMDTNDNFINY